MALWEAYEDEEAEDIPLVCPECGSDDLESLGEDEDGNEAYECEECGECFSDGEDDE